MRFFFILFYVVPLIVAMWVFFDSQKHGYTFWQGLLWAIGVFFLLIVFLPSFFSPRIPMQDPVSIFQFPEITDFFLSCKALAF